MACIQQSETDFGITFVRVIEMFSMWAWLYLGSITSALAPGGGGGAEEGLAYGGGWDARRKFWIRSLKETDLGVIQASFDH